MSIFPLSSFLVILQFCLLHSTSTESSTTSLLTFLFSFIDTKSFDFVHENSKLLDDYSKLSSKDNLYKAIRIENTSLHDWDLKISKTSLKTRWKVLKWGFQQTVIISSENISSISKILWIYGQNVSETTTIFAEISQQSFDAQNGREQFQRGNAFWKMYARLVLILKQKSNELYQAQLICRLCSNALTPPQLEIIPKTHNFIQIYKTLKDLDFQYNIGKGQQSIALLCQIGFRGEIKDTEYHKNLENSARWRYDKYADKSGVMLGILINLYNFTIQRENWESEEGNYSGIYLNPGGDMPRAHIYGRQIVLSYIISEFFIYCRKVPIIPATGWDFLWSPFDMITWIFIFLTGVLFTLYHKGKYSYGMDVLWGVLGLPPTSKWGNSKILSYTLVVLLTLNVGYLSVITSKVIIPNTEADIETPAQLFQQGYRFIDINVTRAAENFFNYWGPPLRAAKINWTKESDILVQVDSCASTHEPKCISHWAGLATGLKYIHEKREQLLQVPAEKRDLCHGVKSPFRNYWVSFYSQGPLAELIYKTQQILIATGIDNFWDRLRKTSSLYDAYRETNHTSSENGDPPKLSFKTPILVVFKAFGVLTSACILYFLVESLYFHCKHKNRNVRKLSRSVQNSASVRIVPSSRKQFGDRYPTVILVTRTSPGSEGNMSEPTVEVLW